MTVTIRSTDHIRGTIIDANRVGVSHDLVIVESDRLNCTIPCKPGSVELELRIPGHGVLVSWGSFRIQLRENSTLDIYTADREVQVRSDSCGSFAVKDVMVWAESAERTLNK